MTSLDDERARIQVNLRLDRALLDELDAAAAADGVDRTELVRRLLSAGVRDHRLSHAIDEYAQGRRSAWSAAEQAGATLYELLDAATSRGVTYRLDPDVLARIAQGRRTDGGPTEPPPEGAGSMPPERDRRDIATGIAELRKQYRPERVRLLLVGESSPAGGTHLYRTDSNLYRAVREALRRATGLGEAPEGSAFLAWLRDLGVWLVDLADEPVDDRPGTARRANVEAGVDDLAATIRAVRPARIVAVKVSIGAAVRAAARAAEADERAVDVLPFPLYQWRAPFIDQLTAITADLFGRGPALPIVPSPGSDVSAVAEAPAGYGGDTLHDVIADVIRRGDGGWQSARRIADRIAAEDLWRRPSDGQPPPATQIAARVRRYPRLFQVSDRGIRLR